MEPYLAFLGYPPAFIAKHSWKYHYFITVLLEGYCQAISDENGYYQIDTAHLKEALKKIQIQKKRSRFYSVIRKDLRSLGIIRYRSFYDAAQGKRVSLYKINDQYLERGWTSIPSTHFQPTVKLLPPEHRIPYSYVQEVMQRISVEESGARNFTTQALQQRMSLKAKKVKFKICPRVMNAEIYSHWMQVIDCVVDGSYFFFADHYGTGRVYNTITSFPKLLRSFLRLNGQSLVEVDVSNCQPLVFVLMLKEWALAQGLADAPDILHYQELCEAGKFYDYLIGLMESNGEVIDEGSFKVDFFTRVFFSTEKKQYKWRKIFAKQFPTVSQCITALKAAGHNLVSIQLQRREADIVIKDAYRTLYESGIVDIFPIHDAILTIPDNRAVVASALVEAFQRAGLQASIKDKWASWKYFLKFLKLNLFLQYNLYHH